MLPTVVRTCFISRQRSGSVLELPPLQDLRCIIGARSFLTSIPKTFRGVSRPIITIIPSPGSTIDGIVNFASSNGDSVVKYMGNVWVPTDLSLPKVVTTRACPWKVWVSMAPSISVAFALLPPPKWWSRPNYHSTTPLPTRDAYLPRQARLGWLWHVASISLSAAGFQAAQSVSIYRRLHAPSSY